MSSPSSARRWSIGRNPDNDYVIHKASVSGHHAELIQLRSGQFILKDLASTNGTFVGNATSRITELALEGNEILFFSSKYSIPFALLRENLIEGNSSARIGQQIDLKKELLRIGRDPDNDICLAPLTVSRKHAEIRRLPDGSIHLRDLDTKTGTVINGRCIKGEEVIVTKDDEIAIGGCHISLTYSDGAAAKGEISVEQRGFMLHAEKIIFQVGGPDGKRLIDGVSLAVYPGEFVALMGPSGCGKSTLLNLLIGESIPAGGCISYDGTNLQRARGTILPYVGHVPQDDLLNPALTVRETLRCYARIRLPADVGPAEIDQKIDEVCQRMGLLDEARGIDLRDQLIGSSERKGLSGGQKKRTSMAMELLSNPRILFLDEPTSGLSSYDAKVVIEQLKTMAREQELAVVVTIHQPSLSIFRLFDNVVYMKLGRLLYYGPAFPDAISYFCPQTLPAEAGPDAVMEALDQADPKISAETYAASRYAKQFIRARFDSMGAKGNDSGGNGGNKSLSTPFIQAKSVLERDVRSRLRDRLALVVLLAQPLLIGGLLGTLFASPSTLDLGTIAFVSALVCYWLGLNGSVRELVSEKCIFQRERRGGLSVPAYLGAKVMLLAAIAAAQTFIFLGVLYLGVSESHWSFFMATGVANLAAFAGIATGLAVGASTSSQIGAVATVPLLLVPMILFGGLLKRYSEFANYAKLGADLNPVRWAFEAFSNLWRSTCIFDDPSLLVPAIVLGGTGLVLLGFVYSRLRR